MLSLAVALMVSAQPSNTWLEEARTLIAALEFTRALEWLEIARQVPANDPETKQAILEWTAYCQVAEGRREDAERTFVKLLELDANAALSREVSSPKVTEAFEAARRKHFPGDYVALTETPAPAGRASLALADPWKRVARVLLHQRHDGASWTDAPLEGASGRFSFPLVARVGGRLDWFVEARAADDTVLASVGSRAMPREVRVPRVVLEATAVPEVPTNTRRVAGIVTLGVGIALSAVATGLAIDAWGLRVAARDRSGPPGDYAATALEAERRALAQQGWAIGLFIAGGLSLGTGLVLAW